jgi:16S rRNA (guanine1516-N2)-methyltransferase
MSLIKIAADRGIKTEQMLALSQQCGIAIADAESCSDYLLYQSEQRLELRCVKDKKLGAVYADFVEGKAQHRRLYGGGKGQQIAKAIGLHKLASPRVWDVTAGLGRDAFVLASLGCHMTLLERSPVIYALLYDALSRLNASEENQLKQISTRMQLENTDALRYLSTLDQRLSSSKTPIKPDVIYLDPMFPQRSKNAQVKKEMRFFHDIAGSDADSDQLLNLARCCAKKRIVVKRPRLAKPLNNIKPNFVISGKSTRYDVYLPLDK